MLEKQKEQVNDVRPGAKDDTGQIETEEVL